MTLAWICGIGASLPLAFEKPAADRHAAFFRRFAIGLAFLLIIYAPVRILFDSQFRSGRPGGEPVLPLRHLRYGCRDDCRNAGLRRAGRGRAAGFAVQSFAPGSQLPGALACDTGDAMLRAGRNADAAYCYDRALVLGPHIPTVLMQAADFYAAVHETSRAMPLMSRYWRIPIPTTASFRLYAKNKVPGRTASLACRRTNPTACARPKPTCATRSNSTGQVRTNCGAL